jgi:hypothetical protein
MALGEPYCTTGELAEQLNLADADTDPDLVRIVDVVTRNIEHHTGRQFNDAVTPSARLYRPVEYHRVDVDDFHTTTGLVVEEDTGSDGTFDTIPATVYTLLPLNGVMYGRTGWPFDEIEFHRSPRAVSSRTWPRPTIRVTARWGWSEVPSDVKQAALIEGARLFGRRYSHNGLIGQGEFEFRVSRLEDPDAAMLLAPYNRLQIAVA